MITTFQLLLFVGSLSLLTGWMQASTRHIAAKADIRGASRIVLAMANEDSTDNKRRRRRRAVKVPNDVVSTEKSVNAPSSSASFGREMPLTQSAASSQINFDAATSIEDMFGLGDNQLRELMETEIPVPREDLATGKTVVQTDKDKVFRLPELSEFITDIDEKKQKIEEFGEEKVPKVDRRNSDEYLRTLQLNPFADADETLFLDEYDIIPSIFGSGKLLGIPVPYLQTGHGILVAVSLLAAFVYSPGNPLTEFPPEIRTFLQQSLLVVYGINSVLAGRAFFVAKEKHLPGFFWLVKTFLFGGVAFYEVTAAVDPTKPAPRPNQTRKLRPKQRT